MIGTGILKGMAVTARNFVGSYFEKERLITVQYPEERSSTSGKLSKFSVLDLRRQRSARGIALRGVQNLREGMSAAVHLHRQERRQKARLHGQTAVLPEGVRHRHLGLHELPDLRRGLSIRGDQDGQGIRAESARAVRSLAFAQRATFQIERVLSQNPSRRSEPLLIRVLRMRQLPPRRRRKLQLKRRRKPRQRSAAAASGATADGETSGRRAVAIAWFFLTTSRVRD